MEIRFTQVSVLSQVVVTAPLLFTVLWFASPLTTKYHTTDYILCSVKCLL